jgi:hypothetical protein
VVRLEREAIRLLRRATARIAQELPR